MLRRPSKTIRQILQQSHLGSLQQRSEQLKQWQHLWQKAVPADLAPFCHCIAVRAGILHIAVASGAWIPRIRMLEPHLIDYFNQFLEQPVHALEIRIDPGLTSRPRPSGQKPGP